MQQALRDRLAGLVFVGFGLAFALGALTYDVGSTLRMGPGYFPLVLGGLLVVLGGVIAVRGFVEEDAAPNGAAPWRALFLVLGAVVLFGLTVRGLGLVRKSDGWSAFCTHDRWRRTGPPPPQIPDSFELDRWPGGVHS